MISFTRILHIVKKELIQFKRYPVLVMVILILPILQLLMFGYAITSDVRNISTYILDMDNSLESRELVQRFEASQEYFNIRNRLSAPAEIDRLLDSNKAQLVLWIPKGFSADLARGRNAQLQVVIDGTDSYTASNIASYVNAITSRYSEGIAVKARMIRGISTVHMPAVEPRVRAWYNPGLKSLNYLVPGVVAMIMMVITIILTSLAVVREREIGTLEQLIVTPIKPIELMIGKTLPFALVGYVNMLTITAFAVFWFRVSIAGSYLLLLLLTAPFLVATLGIGLLVSTVSRTQQQAMMVSFFVAQPSILLSGFIFPIDNMPLAIRLVTYVIPLRYYLEIIRGIFVKGVGLSALWPQVTALCILAVLFITVSARRFTKKLG